MDRLAERYNVDPFIILSIAGIESNYGKHYKGFTVFNSLYTQIHEMPKRAKWASKELASYLEYCFKDNVDPQSIEGSYAVDIISEWETIIDLGDSWYYYVANQEPPSNWNQVNFNSSSWSIGPSGFGYGDGDDNTQVSNTISVYLIKPFSITV